MYFPFLAEAPEFSTAVLDGLRQPLESGTISIHRVNGVAHFPARFQLLLAANPCPCGQYGARDTECVCPPTMRRRYIGRLSGPLLDRIDLHTTVHRVTSARLRLATDSPGLSTAQARATVVRARGAAEERLLGTPWSINSQVPGAWLRAVPRRLPSAVTLGLDRALERGGITMRGYDRVLRVSWTLADIDGAPSPRAEHIGRALYLRKAVST